MKIAITKNQHQLYSGLAAAAAAALTELKVAQMLAHACQQRYEAAQLAANSTASCLLMDGKVLDGEAIQEGSRHGRIEPVHDSAGYFLVVHPPATEVERASA